MNEFFAMGGYGKYLWPSFALGFGIVILNLVLALELAEARAGAGPAPPGDAVMMARHKRLLMVLGIVAGVGIAATLAIHAFKSNVMFFFDPSQIAAGEAPADKRFRLGGMVEKGSVQRHPARSTCASWSRISSTPCRVKYSGILPDLFREGQGVVAHGRMQGGTFVADEILAKHDEKYMPPEVARSLKDKPPPPNVVRRAGTP